MRALRARTGLAIAASVGVVLAIAAALWLLRRNPAPVEAAADARIERALALEAERAVREAPRDGPPALSPEGLRALEERWQPQADAAAARRWVPAPVTPDALRRARGRAPGPRVEARRFARERPAQRGDPRIRLLANPDSNPTPR